MSLLNLLGISDAFAEAATTAATAGGQPQQGSLLSLLPTLILFAVVFYFLLIRPQSKRAKEQRKLLDGLTKDDEVVTNGGLMGKIIEINDSLVVLKVAKDVEVTFQKNAIGMILPKGTIKTI